MAIELKENFQVAAPAEKVWQFLMRPENVVACMPGASLTQVIDARSFLGTVKLKIGAVTAQYQGKITYTDTDPANHSVTLLAEGTERGGGTVSGAIRTRLVPLPGDTATEVRVQSSIDLTGRILQVGRGMIEGVSAQIIRKYVANVKAMLEVPAAQAAPPAATGEPIGAPAAAATAVATSAGAAPAAAAMPATASTTAATPPPREDSIDVGSVVWSVLRERIAAFFRRLFGRH